MYGIIIFFIASVVFATGILGRHIDINSLRTFDLCLVKQLYELSIVTVLFVGFLVFMLKKKVLFGVGFSHS